MSATAVTAKTLAMSGVIACGLGILGASTASATVYFDNTFSTETPNTSADTPNPGYSIGQGPVTTGSYAVGGGMTAPTSANGSSIGRKATVFAANPAVTGFNSQAVGLFSHPSAFAGVDEGVIRINPPGGTNNPLTGTTTGQQFFSFDLSVGRTDLNTSTWTVKPTMILMSNYASIGGHDGFTPMLSVSESLGNIILTSSTGTAGGISMNTNIVSGFTALTPYHIAATLDMDTATFTVAVNGAPVGGTFNQLVPQSWGKGFSGYVANGGQPDATNSVEGNFHFYDNINLQSAPVPEPASLALLGLSTAGLLLRRKRH